MRTTVRLTGLRFAASIGVHPHERERMQTLAVDLVVEVAPRQVLLTRDAFADVLDYEALRAAVLDLAATGHFDTQEWFATSLVRRLIALPQVTGLSLTVHKPDAFADAEAVGVGVELTAGDVEALRHPPPDPAEAPGAA